MNSSLQMEGGKHISLLNLLIGFWYSRLIQAWVTSISDAVNEFVCVCYTVLFFYLSSSALCTFSPTLALCRAQDLFYTKQHLLLTVSKISPGAESRKSSSECMTEPGLEWGQMVQESGFPSCIPKLATNSRLNLLIIVRKAELCPWSVTFTSLCLRVQCTQQSSTIQWDWMNI